MRQGLIEAREGHPAFPRSCVCGAFRQSGAHIAGSALGEASAPAAAISCQFILVRQTSLRKHCRRPGTSRPGLIERERAHRPSRALACAGLFGTRRREADAVLSVCPARVKPWSAYARHPSVFAVKGSPTPRPAYAHSPTALRSAPSRTLRMPKRAEEHSPPPACLFTLCAFHVRHQPTASSSSIHSSPPSSSPPSSPPSTGGSGSGTYCELNHSSVCTLQRPIDDVSASAVTPVK